ncbi:hypothetical protein FB004_1166 [Sinorhizobium medicae]|nr:hypothetical protein FB004_1166 [Sinorhizobium medicae]
MKCLIKLTLATALAAGTAYGALAQEFTKATVKKVDVKEESHANPRGIEEPRDARHDHGVPRPG